jgi:pilus assembly protein CpaE
MEWKKKDIKIGGNLNVLAVMRSADAREDFAAAVEDVEGVKVSVEEGDLDDVGSQLMNSHAPDVLVIDVQTDDPAEMSRLSSVIRESERGISVIATGVDATLDDIRRLMRLGVVDYLPQPISRSDVLSTLEAMVQRRRAAASAQAVGRALTFIKSGGGMGATTLAIQTALCLRHLNQGKAKVCILDLDLQFGNVALYLDLDPGLTAGDVISAPERLDSSLLLSVMSHHESGVDVLAAPRELVPLNAMTPKFASQLIELACQHYEHVVVDLPQDWTDWTHAVLSHSGLVALVTQLSVGAIRQARRQLDILASEDLGHVPLAVVLNRYEKRPFASGIRVKEAEKALGRSIDHFIPNDYKTVSEALNRGVPVAQIKRRCKVEKRIRGFVDSSLKTLTARGGRAESVAA